MKNRIIDKLKGVLRKNPRLFSFLKRIKHRFRGKQDRRDVLKARFERAWHPSDETVSFYTSIKSKVRVIDKRLKSDSLYKLLSEVEIDSPKDEYFFYSIDVYKTWYNQKRLMVNSTLDYKRVIDAPLTALYVDESNNAFAKENNRSVDALLKYLDRCAAYVRSRSFQNKQKMIAWFENMKSSKANSFEEALQRILFVNQILWQTEHRLVGLGRLDYILNEIYHTELERKTIDRNSAKTLIKDFMTSLHRFYWYKSDALMGDTGQIIIVGGNEPGGGYFCNDLTYAFIDSVRELQKPDPKVLLRVGRDMPNSLMEAAVDCISTGVGCPLLSNDDQVIPRMISFGYAPEDAYNYVTSACWEPLIPSVAHEQNNLEVINFLLPFDLLSEKEGFSKFSNFDDLLEGYLRHLEGHIWYVGTLLDRISWEQDPLVSAFTEPCRQSHKDVSVGGGKYNNYGILSLALANAVNAFYAIEKYVFQEKRFTLKELDFYRKNNFRGHEDVRTLLRSAANWFGSDDPRAVELTNKILDRANISVERYRNMFGEKAKFGLSSPGYIQVSENYPASFDGRKWGDPFAVHISADGGNAYTELMQFAAKLDYSATRFNGNVVDFFVSPNFIQSNYNKFVSFLRLSIETGIFQTQINVVSSKTLIAARENPAEYPNLIVRVWGFSAYYVELPDAYKDYLIERALQHERVS